MRADQYRSISELKTFHINLSDNPIFSEYTKNLVNILSINTDKNENRKKNIISFDHIHIMVGLSPRNIFIPADVNDFITKIMINLDNQ